MAVRVTVVNGGPVVRADIKVHPLTVFVGPNNSGKSVVATVILATMTAVNQHLFGRPAMFRQRLTRQHSEVDRIFVELQRLAEKPKDVSPRSMPGIAEATVERHEPVEQAEQPAEEQVAA
jgi:predicted ATPase